MGSTVIAFAKIQRSKKLFTYDEFGAMIEQKATAVIDFYVHQNYAKQGYGKALIGHLMTAEYHPKDQIAFYKLSKGFASFLNRSFNGKVALKKLDDDFVLMHKPNLNSEPKSIIPTMVKSTSQTNLSALNASQKFSSRGNVFNTAGRDLITQSTSDLSKLKDNDMYEPPTQESQFQDSKKMNFDEYLIEYERIKAAERNKSPAEHRSKYYNDVFSSSVNLGNKKDTNARAAKIMMEVEQKFDKEPLTARPICHPTPMTKFQQQMIKDDYVPSIPAEFKKQPEKKELVKPKGRFRDWRPEMRDLESSYQVEARAQPKREVCIALLVNL